MKKCLFMFFYLVILLSHLHSQDIPPPNPSLTINIVSGYSVMFLFDNLDKFKDGIMNGGQSTFIRVGSVTDWQLQFKADQSIFYGDNDPGSQMELNNVGLTVISTGTNLDDGSNIINYAKTVPIALDATDVTILTKGTLTNKGFGVANAFTLNWEMGTRRGNMNNQSMLEQLLNPDTYSLNIVLTLSVVP